MKARLKIDLIPSNGNQVGVYWEGSPGKAVAEFEQEVAEKIVEGLNASDHPDDFFCQHCGMLLKRVVEHEHTYFKIVSLDGTYEAEKTRRTYACCLCYKALPIKQAERLGIAHD